MITDRNKSAARQLLGEKRVELEAIVARNWSAIADVASELCNRQKLSGTGREDNCATNAPERVMKDLERKSRLPTTLS